MKISAHYNAELNAKEIVNACLFPFPYIWASAIKLHLVFDA